MEVYNKLCQARATMFLSLSSRSSVSRSVTPPHRKVGSRWTRPNRRVCARPPVRLPPKGVCVYYVYYETLKKSECSLLQ